MVEESVQTKFIKSKEILTQYLKEHKKVPTGKEWDKYAVILNCLSSKTMGFIDGEGFKSLCYKIKEDIKKSI